MTLALPHTHPELKVWQVKAFFPSLFILPPPPSVCVYGGWGCIATAREWEPADSWESSLAFHQVGFKEGTRSHQVSMSQPRPLPFTMAAQGALHAPPGPRSPTLAPLCAAQGGVAGVKRFDPNRGSDPLQAPPTRGSAPPQPAPLTQV